MSVASSNVFGLVFIIIVAKLRLAWGSRVRGGARLS